MQKCVKEKCEWINKYGKCASVCIEQGYAHRVSNYDHVKDLDIEQMAMLFAEKILANDRTVKNKVQAVCLKMALYDRCLRWLDSEWEAKE